MRKFNPIFIALTGLFFLMTALASNVANAEELYRWKEADGSLTFSPVPPPANSGIAYEKISGKTGIRAASTDSPQGIQPGVQPLAVNSNPVQATLQVQTPALVAPVTQSIAPDTKTGHCKELRKRVQSLERLITTDVSNEIMDNAVVQMARYQTSFNQSCQGILTQGLGN